jgi:hypothetical protein
LDLIYLYLYLQQYLALDQPVLASLQGAEPDRRQMATAAGCAAGGRARTVRKAQPKRECRAPAFGCRLFQEQVTAWSQRLASARQAAEPMVKHAMVGFEKLRMAIGKEYQRRIGLEQEILAIEQRIAALQQEAMVHRQKTKEAEQRRLAAEQQAGAILTFVSICWDVHRYSQGLPKIIECLRCHATLQGLVICLILFLVYVWLLSSNPVPLAKTLGQLNPMYAKLAVVSGPCFKSSDGWPSAPVLVQLSRCFKVYLPTAFSQGQLMEDAQASGRVLTAPWTSGRTLASCYSALEVGVYTFTVVAGT